MAELVRALHGRSRHLTREPGFLAQSPDSILVNQELAKMLDDEPFQFNGRQSP
jgi:hypothetical protein